MLPLPPVTQALLLANVAVFFLGELLGPGLLSSFALWPLGSGFWPWQILTYAFLHGSFNHLFFNMLWLYDLGGSIELRRGVWRFGALVLVAAVAGNLGQYYYQHLPRFGGMSGVDYALFGYVWMKGRYEPEQGMIMHPSNVQTMLFWLVLCFTGLFGPIANVAHVVGLIVGILFGLARF